MRVQWEQQTSKEAIWQDLILLATIHCVCGDQSDACAVGEEMQGGYWTGFNLVVDFIEGSPAAKCGLIQVWVHPCGLIQIQIDRYGLIQVQIDSGTD